MRAREEVGKALIASSKAVIDWAMNRGGDVGRENGEPVSRVWPRVETMASLWSGSDETLASRDCWRAERRSDEDVGVPFAMVSLSSVNVDRAVGSRARAVTV